MLRRSFIQNTALSFAALTLVQQNLLSSFFEDPWKISMLRNDVGIFTERGGTIAFLLTKKGIAIVDSQFADQSKHLITELQKKTEKPFQLLINTHHHADHTSGNIAFKGMVEHVVAHANSLKNQWTSSVANKTHDKQLYPDQTYTDTWDQKVGKEKISLSWHGAAHTNGDSFVHFEDANIVHMGDLVFNHRHPNVDRAAGANIKSWIAVLDKGINKFNAETIFVFGHSGTGYEITGKMDDVKKFSDYLGKVLQFTEAEIKAGKSREDFLKAKIIPGAEDWAADGIERPLGAAYDELTAK